MNTLQCALILLALLAASCAAPAVTSSVPVASATVAAHSTAPIAASGCTSTTATTRQVVERVFELSTSNDPRAVIDCYAQSWRDKDPNFEGSAALWSREGPATDLVVTLVDVVNGCDRFRVTAQMPNNQFWNSGQRFASVGPDGDGPRIYDTGTALLAPGATTVHCP